MQAKILYLQAFLGENFTTEGERAALEGVHTDLQALHILPMMRLLNDPRSLVQLGAIDTEQTT